MKKNIIPFIAAILLFACNNQSDQVLLSADNLPDFNPTLVLMHPTVNNLRTIKKLTEDKVFPLSDTIQILGVFHSSGSYNYDHSVEYIKEQHINNFKLLKVEEVLTPEILYKENILSDTYRSIFSNSKGIIFFGGPDLPPDTYGEETLLLTEITDVHRHYFELSFLFHLLGGSQDSLFVPLLQSKTDYRILGICLGMQSINVATGGTMVQDIPSELYGVSTLEEVLSLDKNMRHRNYFTNFGLDNELIWGHFHQVKYDSESLFDSLNAFSTNLPFVWSSHHQAIETLGKDILPIAWSMDSKIIEAVLHKKYPNVIGVQFHPEVTSIYDSNAKLKISPNNEAMRSYLDMYPDSGEEFHRAIWSYIGGMYK